MTRRISIMVGIGGTLVLLPGCARQPAAQYESVSSTPPRDSEPIAQGDVFPEREHVELEKLPPP